MALIEDQWSVVSMLLAKQNLRTRQQCSEGAPFKEKTTNCVALGKWFRNHFASPPNSIFCFDTLYFLFVPPSYWSWMGKCWRPSLPPSWIKSRSIWAWLISSTTTRSWRECHSVCMQPELSLNRFLQLDTVHLRGCRVSAILTAKQSISFAC